MKTIWILLGLIILFSMLVCYAALTVARRADEWEREYWENRRKE